MTTGTAVSATDSSSDGFVVDNLYLNNSTWDLWKCTGTDVWSLQGNIKGEVGDPGQPGAPGENGEPGSDGTNSYIYIRYSANADGTGFDATPTPTKKYMGVYAGPSSTAPTNKTSYAWVKYIGEDGLGAGDMLKSTYDTNGNGMVDMAESLNGLAASIEELNYMDGVTENVQTALDAKQPTTNNLTAETAIADADTVPFYDASATDNRKSTWSNIKSVLKTYFDTLYNNYTLPTASSSTKGGIKIGANLTMDGDTLNATGGGGGIAPSNVANIVAKIGNGLVKLTWQDPNDTYVDGNLLCTWQGTKVVYKTGSYPTNETDGTLVIDSTTRNAYENDELSITGLTNDTPYYFAFFPYSDQGVVNKNIANRITATPRAYFLFGYYDDTTDSNPETKIHYIEMNENFTPARMVAAGGWTEGDWTEANCWFVKNNKPYMVKYDGTIDYELCHTDYSKKIDGVTASDVSNTSYAGNAMASIPCVWVKRYTQNGRKYHLFCNIQLTEDFHAYAHTRSDGTIEPYTWFPLFGGSLVSSKCRSIAGQTQMNTQTGTNEITYCKANGSLWNTGYWSAFMLRCELETLLTRSTNKQDSCGYGNYTGGSAAANLLKTGTQLTGGRFFGYGSTVNKARKFLHCEWQMGAWERINGLLYVSGTYRVKQYEPYNETGADYISTGLSMSGTSGNYISAGTLNDNGEFPTALSGSSDTYYCCGGWYNAGQVDHAFVDGTCGNGLSCGGAVGVNGLVSYSDWHFSARPYCKTPTTAQASDIED